MEDIIIDFGKNLKKYRKSASLSRHELGELIAYSAKSVEKWELGGSPPPIATICKIAKVFAVYESVYRYTEHLCNLAYCSYWRRRTSKLPLFHRLSGISY